MKISACLVVYNEEKHIKECLESIKEVVDEIIVVHDGPCRDTTLKIARSYCAKIFVRPRIGEAEPHRPFSFEKGSGEWILQIDADERLSPELQFFLKKFKDDKSVDAYAFNWEDPDRIYFFGIFSLKQYKPCFFRKSKIKLLGLVHEQTRTSGRMVNSELLLLHRPKIKIYQTEVFRRKTRQWGETAARQLLKKDLAPHSAYFYLLKAPFWAFLYLFFYLFIKGFVFCGRNGWWVIRYHTTYNFFLNYYLFALKRNNFYKKAS